MASVFNRYRSRASDWTVGGIATSLGPPLGDHSQSDYYRSLEDMWDVVGNRDGVNDLLKMTRSNTVGYFSGQGSHYYTCSDWAIPDNWYFWDFSGGSGEPTEANLALATLAGTNPSRPAVDLPVAIAEFKDFPRMLKHIGNRIQRGHKGLRGLIKDYTPEMAAEDSLALQFGWAPLLSDLIKLLGFQSSVNERINELTRLYNGDTGLNRNYSIHRWTLSKGKRSFFCGPLYSAQTLVEVSYEQQLKNWGSVNWLPTTAPEYSNQDEQLDYAKRLVTGTKDLNVSSIWNAVPWTWMMDWFGATGDFLEAHRNTVPAQSSDLCVMANHAIKAVSFDFLDNPWGGSFHLEADPLAEYKVRTAMFGIPNPDVRLPFLSGRQLSILTPLAIQSFGRRR